MGVTFLHYYIIYATCNHAMAVNWAGLALAETIRIDDLLLFLSLVISLLALITERRVNPLVKLPVHQ